MVTPELERKDGRYKVGAAFFINFPITKGAKFIDGTYRSKRLKSIVGNDYVGTTHFWAENTMQLSIYYWWWELLRRHSDYAECCRNGGKGKYAKLYEDFGNVHESDDVWQWWTHKMKNGVERGVWLFSELEMRDMEVVYESAACVEGDHTLMLRVPLEMRTNHIIQRLRTILKQHEGALAAARRTSRARYKIASNTSAEALQKLVRVWDVEEKYGKTRKRYEKYLLSGLAEKTQADGIKLSVLKKKGEDTSALIAELRRQSTQEYGRLLKKAEIYIYNIGLGVISGKNYKG